jgi:8-oxo-dGTP pyrophosphatase MutT (NUDIX family)
MNEDLPGLDAFLRTRLAAPLPGAEAQWRFAPSPAFAGWAPDLTPEHARRAAALILIYPGPDGPTIPLTVRRADLPHHPGQVSLPGGALDPGESPQEAALRETQEELGVARERPQIIGPLSTLWVIVSNFVVHPFVATMDQRPMLLPEPREVAEVLEVPLSEIFDRARIRWERRTMRGREIAYPHFTLQNHAVWGATAMILGEFAHLFDATFEPPDPSPGVKRVS